MHLAVYSIYTMRRFEWTHRHINRGSVTRMKSPIDVSVLAPRPLLQDLSLLH